MERWRTKALVAGVALIAVPAAIAAVVMQSSGPSSREQGPAGHARLLPAGQNPLRVKGAGFVPGERVRVKLLGERQSSRAVIAGPRGAFAVAFPKVSGCGSATVSATGSRGSRAAFNLSQIVCLEP